MPSVLNMINEIQEIVEETTFEQLTINQLSKLSKEYNTYFNSMEIADTDSYIMFSMSKEAFKRFEYYCDMEYERDEIRYKVETEDDVLVIYDSSCERASEIIYRATGKQVGDFEEDE